MARRSNTIWPRRPKPNILPFKEKRVEIRKAVDYAVKPRLSLAFLIWDAGWGWSDFAVLMAMETMTGCAPEAFGREKRRSKEEERTAWQVEVKWKGEIGWWTIRPRPFSCSPHALSTTRSIRTAFSVHFCVLSLVNNDWVRRADWSFTSTYIINDVIDAWVSGVIRFCR